MTGRTEAPRRGVSVAVLAAVLLVASVLVVAAPEASASSVVKPGGRFTPTTPCRVADTRVVGPALNTSSTRTFQVAGTGLAAQGGKSGGCGVPVGAIAAVLTVHAVSPSGPGYLRVWPAGEPQPNATVLNYPSGVSTSNTAEVPLSAAGEISVRGFTSGTHLVIDVTGFFLNAPSGNGFTPVPPCRVADTRVVGPRLAASDRTFTVIDPGPASQGGNPSGCGIPASAVAVVLSVHAVAPSGPGYLRVWPAGEPQPNATLVNYSGASMTNSATVPLSPSGEVTVRHLGGGDTHLVLDVTGFYDSSPTGLVFSPLTPCRVVDTRVAVGVMTGVARDSSTLGVQPRYQGGSSSGCRVPFGARAAALSVHAVSPSGAGYLRVWPSDVSMPTATVLNFQGGVSMTNTVAVQLDTKGGFTARNFNPATHMVVDLNGFFSNPNETTVHATPMNGGGFGSNWAVGASLSADGRFVVFTSYANNLVPGDTNGAGDVFVHDRWSNQTRRVSVSTGGTEGNDDSFEASISPDGRFIAFTSYANNLVPDDTNGASDVFIRDLLTGVTSRVSVSTGGTEGNDGSFSPSVSVDGTKVAFASYADNLVGGDTNGTVDVFVRNAAVATTTLVSVNATMSGPGNAGSFDPAISGDGTRVAFASDATDLVAGDTNAVTDVFVRDLPGPAPQRVSVSTGGTEGNGVAAGPSISFDGSAIAFMSYASNLTTLPDVNGVSDVFVRYPGTSTTLLASRNASATAAGNGNSFNAAVTGDGRSVVYSSYASDLTSGDSNDANDVFVHEVQSGTNRRASLTSGGAQVAAGTIYEPATDMSGAWVLFLTTHPAVPADTNSAGDGYLRGLL